MAHRETPGVTSMLVAEVGLGELLWWTIELFFLFMFIWIFIVLIADIFRDHEMSGWGKAGWILLLIIVPLIGSLIYIIVRGPSMAERSANQAAAAQADIDRYIRDAASTGPADDISRLATLRDNGTISEEEFQTMKARVVNA
jgi:Phospholipase_D-nuclease N-terminal/Short C-terminal domain